ncbi:RNA pyrophosphohydrolase [uncultured archaeon]|nr:RNA pyrophosphohydrolase [uncultured archaeon]
MAIMLLHSSGLLIFRLKNGSLQVLLVHPGGPFWTKKDEGAWSIPKGLMKEGESPLAAARREFREETGFDANGEFLDLGEICQSGRKTIRAHALQKDLDEKLVISNRFCLEWPKGSGIMKEYPEIDRACWFDADQAKKKIHRGQAAFVDRLIKILDCRI